MEAFVLTGLPRDIHRNLRKGLRISGELGDFHRNVIPIQ